MKQRLKDIILILSLIIFIAISLVLIIILDSERYDKACSSTPSKIWIEEDLEMVFLTTQVHVLEIENEGDGVLIVKVRIYDEDEYRTYRCLYEIKRYRLSYYAWEFVRYV